MICLVVGRMLKDEVAAFYIPQISPIGAEFLAYLR
jgi:hypothetical protein